MGGLFLPLQNHQHGETYKANKVILYGITNQYCPMNHLLWIRDPQPLFQQFRQFILCLYRKH